jgi:hypothetical protein
MAKQRFLCAKLKFLSEIEILPNFLKNYGSATTDPHIFERVLHPLDSQNLHQLPSFLTVLNPLKFIYCTVQETFELHLWLKCLFSSQMHTWPNLFLMWPNVLLFQTRTILSVLMFYFNFIKILLLSSIGKKDWLQVMCTSYLPLRQTPWLEY